MSNLPLADAQTATFVRFATVWANRTPVALPNQPFTEPQGTPWVRATFDERDGDRVTIGALPLRHRRSILWVQLFEVVGRGSKTGAGYADDLRAAFEDQKFGGIDGESIECVGVNVRPSRNVGGTWFQTNIEILLSYYQHR